MSDNRYETLDDLPWGADGDPMTARVELRPGETGPTGGSKRIPHRPGCRVVYARYHGSKQVGIREELTSQPGASVVSAKLTN